MTWTRRIVTAALVLFLTPFAYGQGTIAPFPKHTMFDNSGAICAGCQLFTYQSGTSTKLSTYSEATLSSANTNPIVLDSAGRATIFLSATTYKFVLASSTDTDPPTSPLWTVDGVAAAPSFAVNLDISGTAGQTLAVGKPVFVSDGSGGNTAGRWYLTSASSDYSSTITRALGMVITGGVAGDTVSIRLAGRVTGLSGLATGTLYYLSTTSGQLTTTAPSSFIRPFGVADSATSLVMSHFVRQSPATWNVTEGTEGILTLGTQILKGAKEWVDAADFDAALNVDGAFTNTSTTGAAFTANHPTFKPGASGLSGTTTLVNGVIYTDAATHTTSASATETDLSTFSIPANTLSANGKAIRITVYGKYAATGNNKTVKFYWNGAAIWSTSTLAENNTGWMLTGIITRTSQAGAVGVQSHRGYVIYGGAALNNSSPGSGTTATPLAWVGDNLAGDATGAIAIKTTATDATAAGGTTQTSFIVEIVG